MSDPKAAEQIDRNANQYLTVKYLNGLCEYEKVWRAMQNFTDARDSQSEDQIWVLQHLPVYTQGQAGKPEHVLNPNGIPVVQVDRGGQVTFHGPGQLVVYILFDIDRMGIGTRRLVTLIETSMIETLALYGIKAKARKDAPGVYIDGKKIGSVGLRIRKGRSFHGLSLNIDMDLSPFQGINPCGYEGMEMTQLAEFEGAEPLEQVAGRMVGEIARQFNFQGVQMEYVEQV